MTKPKDKKEDNSLPPLGNYSNFLALNYNLNEVYLDFGQTVPNNNIARLHTRIITSPQHLMGMRDHITAILNDIAKKAKESKKGPEKGEEPGKEKRI